ncbi:MAG TPA: holo-ACP synthase [Candidatus Izemoplasmatales bacterium]|nr:holo-ACP synthase [Bacillota bacterium]HRY77561.1 holo-ACP synthase [Candidatus Izemoplasmatales bacterium]
MIQGIGCDIVEIARLKDEIKHKILSPNELRVYDRFTSESRKQEFLAGRFAVKEAIVKAAGLVPFPEMDVIDDENGKPHLTCARLSGRTIHLSISHEKAFAIGFCVVEAPDL